MNPTFTPPIPDLPSAEGRPACFLDRDGVINREHGYVHREADFELLPGVLTALQTLQEWGFALVVVTNQSGIGRRLYSEQDYLRVQACMLGMFREHQIEVSGVYYCPHAPEANCECRKPSPGMIWQAQREHRLDLGQSWLVGDKESDLEAAQRAGIPHRVLVRSGHPISARSPAATHVCDDLSATVAVMQRMLRWHPQFG